MLQHLPTEILVNILQFLTFTDYQVILKVCSRLLEILKDLKYPIFSVVLNNKSSIKYGLGLIRSISVYKSMPISDNLLNISKLSLYSVNGVTDSIILKFTNLSELTICFCWMYLPTTALHKLENLRRLKITVTGIFSHRIQFQVPNSLDYFSIDTDRNICRKLDILIDKDCKVQSLQILDGTVSADIFKNICAKDLKIHVRCFDKLEYLGYCRNLQSLKLISLFHIPNLSSQIMKICPQLDCFEY